MKGKIQIQQIQEHSTHRSHLRSPPSSFSASVDVVDTSESTLILNNNSATSQSTSNSITINTVGTNGTNTNNGTPTTEDSNRDRDNINSLKTNLNNNNNNDVWFSRYNEDSGITLKQLVLSD